MCVRLEEYNLSPNSGITLLMVLMLFDGYFKIIVVPSK